MSKEIEGLLKETPAKKLLNKSLNIISRELHRLSLLEKLDFHETRALNDYVRTLVSVDRNERQSDIEEDLTKMSDEELKMLTERAVSYLGAGNE